MFKTLIKICLWALAFVPLVVDLNVFFPYVSGKNLLIESCLVLAGILFIGNYIYSKSFREEITEKFVRYIKNPLVVSIFSFFFIFVISTIFAVDKYVAFWGDLSRAEGLAGTMFFFAFFIFSLLTFEKKDWLWFFELGLLASLILLGKEFVEFFSGVLRPGSLIGNPTFLAGYLLFSVTSSLIVLAEAESNFFKYLSILTIILSIIGIFIAETRGTILGLGIGIVVALIYCVFKGKQINYKIFNLRQTAIIFLSIGIVFLGAFAITRKSEVWQNVPGLSRLALTNATNAGDISTPVRLYLYKSSIASVNPVQNSWKKLLIGWGPDNYASAESKNYDPALYNMEPDWHDRAHNKFLDVLVMNGLTGLLAYLAIWFFLFKHIFKKKEFSLINISLLLFATSFLIHLAFVFDEISTSIPFFASLAYFIYFSSDDKNSGPIIEEKKSFSPGIVCVPLVLLLCFIFISETVPSYLQTKEYFSLIKTNDVKLIQSNFSSVSAGKLTSQRYIIIDFLRTTSDYYDTEKNQIAKALLDKAIESAEEYLVNRPDDFVFMISLVSIYNDKGRILKDVKYLERGEALFRIILSYAPNRPDINRALGFNLFYQKKFLESFGYFEKSFDLNPSFLDQDKLVTEGYYAGYIKYFYTIKDRDNFIKAANRLKQNKYVSAYLLDKIISYLDEKGTWPLVNFQ